MWSKRFSLLLVAFCFLSSALSAEVCLTDGEFLELEQNLTELDNTLTEQAQQIAQLQALLTISNREIQQVKNSFSAAEKYWRRQRLEVAVLAGSGGIVAGILIHWLIGVLK